MEKRGMKLRISFQSNWEEKCKWRSVVTILVNFILYNVCGVVYLLVNFIFCNVCGIVYLLVNFIFYNVFTCELHLL